MARRYNLSRGLILVGPRKYLRFKIFAKFLKDFYEQLPKETFPQLRKQAEILLSLFGSTYLCDQGFSKTTLLKAKLR